MTNASLRKAPRMGARVLRNTEQMLAYCQSNSFVVFDRESTHFQPNDHYGKIIEISAVKIVDGVIVDKFDTLVNPEIRISKEITALTGITNEMVADAPNYKKVVTDFIQFCKGSIVVAHNALIDIKFVNFFSSKIGIPFEPQFIDTINLCKYIDQKSNAVSDGPFTYNLKDMAIKYGIPNDNHHRAMNDTIATAYLFLKLKDILKRDIGKHHYEEAHLDLNDASTAVIGSVNYWEKELSNKVYKRLYVRLILNDKTNEIFYDFMDGCWGIKKAEFNMPDLGFMTDKLMQHMKLTDKTKVYEISTYKKG